MGSFRIATIRGIPVRVHFTLLLVLPLLAVVFSQSLSDAAQMAEVPPGQLVGSPLLWGMGFAVALFASVLLHELAHSLYALRTGGKVRDITLLMIGGISSISEPPKRVRDEAVMALVGPLVSLGLGGLLYGGYALLAFAEFNVRFALFYLGTLNLFLGAFNLLPAFPMDGGRILRALLVRRMGPVGATRAASTVGKGFALLFGLWGLISFNLILLAIAFFVFMGAEGERRAAEVKAALAGVRVADVMTPQVDTISQDQTLAEAARRLTAKNEVELVVESNERPVGVLTLESVQAAPADRRGLLRVQDAMQSVASVAPDDELTDAITKMDAAKLQQLPVAAHGTLVGVLTRDGILRGIKLRDLRERKAQSRWRWGDASAG